MSTCNIALSMAYIKQIGGIDVNYNERFDLGLAAGQSLTVTFIGSETKVEIHQQGSAKRGAGRKRNAVPAPVAAGVSTPDDGKTDVSAPRVDAVSAKRQPDVDETQAKSDDVKSKDATHDVKPRKGGTTPVARVVKPVDYGFWGKVTSAFDLKQTTAALNGTSKPPFPSGDGPFISEVYCDGYPATPECACLETDLPCAIIVDGEALSAWKTLPPVRSVSFKDDLSNVKVLYVRPGTLGVSGATEGLRLIKSLFADQAFGETERSKLIEYLLTHMGTKVVVSELPTKRDLDLKVTGRLSQLLGVSTACKCVVGICLQSHLESLGENRTIQKAVMPAGTKNVTKYAPWLDAIGEANYGNLTFVVLYTKG